MFKFLKDKLKEAISSISKKVETTNEESKVFDETFSKKVSDEEKIEKEISETQEEIKKSIFTQIKEKVTLKKITKEKFYELFEEIQLALLENNVAHEVIEKIKNDLEKDLVDIPIKRNEIKIIVKNSIKKTIQEILNIEKIDLSKLIKDSKKKPFTILVLGYNRVGKSLTIAKIAKFLKDKNLKVILAAGDTFRAAGSSQLVEYAKKIDIPVIKGQQGSDSCSIIFDTINSAKSRDFDVVLADTAGRIHNDQNLLNELKKIARVNKPDFNILVIDAMTGSDVVNQAQEFNKSVNIDALVLTKVDAYEKGGALLTASYVIKKPILFLGVGQNFKDLKEFNKDEIIKNLGF